MQRILTIFLIATLVAIIGHATHWFGVARPALNKTNARIDATNTDVAANRARIATGEQKTAALEATANEHAKRLAETEDIAKDAAAAARAAQGDVARLTERVDANSAAIGDIKAQIAAATPNAEEQLLRRDLMNAMAIASQFKAAVAESIQSEGKLPASNAQVGLSAPDRYADGSLLRIAIEQGAIVASFKPSELAGAGPRLRLVPGAPGADPVGLVRWKCDTNIAVAAKLFATCELKS